MRKIDAEECIRKVVVIDDEKYYLLIGDQFVMATVPYENRPENMKKRHTIETLCAAVTQGLCELKGSKQ